MSLVERLPMLHPQMSCTPLEPASSDGHLLAQEIAVWKFVPSTDWRSMIFSENPPPLFRIML
jgi:hypothetical protein